MPNPSFQLSLGRSSVTSIADTDSEYLTDVFSIEDHGVVVVSLSTSRDLTLTFLHGQASDADDALPHGADQAITGAALGEGVGSDYFFKVPAGCTVGRIKASNASGGVATIVADTGLSVA